MVEVLARVYLLAELGYLLTFTTGYAKDKARPAGTGRCAGAEQVNVDCGHIESSLSHLDRCYSHLHRSELLLLPDTISRAKESALGSQQADYYSKLEHNRASSRDRPELQP